MFEFYILFIILSSVSAVLSLILFIMGYVNHVLDSDFEKLSVYECGFDPFEDTRSKFDVKYYLLAILYIVFDLEIIYFVPWTITSGRFDFFCFFIIFLFLFILIIGFLYEWYKGALEWN